MAHRERYSHDGRKPSSGSAADDELDTDTSRPPLVRGQVGWNLPDRLQTPASLHTPHHHDKRFVPRSTKLSLLICKNIKQVWVNRILLLIELIFPIVILTGLCIFVSTYENQTNPEPHTYQPFGFEAVTLKSCTHIVFSPRCAFTEDIAQRLTSRVEQYRLINSSAYQYLADNDVSDLHVERGELCAQFQFENAPLTKRPYQLPANIKYKIRLPAIPQSNANNGRKAAEAPAVSVWDTTLTYTSRIRSGARNTFDNDGGSPGYNKEGFLFLQRMLDYTLIEIIYAKERGASVAWMVVPRRYSVIDKVHPLLQRFPYPAYANRNLKSMLTKNLAAVIIFCYLPVYVVNTWLLVKERQAGAKGHLSYFNISPWHCWVAWITYKMFLYSIGLVPVVSLLMFGWKYERAIINRSNPLLFYFFLWTYILNAVSMSCTMSTWFSNATTASVAAAAYWVVSYIPVAYMDQNVQLFPLLMKYFCCISPNTGLLVGLQIIALAELNSDGVTWGRLFTEDFDLGHVIAIFLVLVILRILLAIYFEHIFPSTNEFGFRIPWFYFFHLWWWRGQLPRNKKHVMTKVGPSEREKKYPALFNDIGLDPVRKELQLMAVTKVVDGLKVLSDINLEFTEGEVFTILGAEQSGKSSLFSLCTARSGTTTGTIWLRKRDFALNTKYARTNIGYCTDENFLYDYLTVEEHISFFVQLKGVLHAADAYEEIELLLTGLDLFSVRRTLAGKLTYAQQRLVHIAMAFCGGSKIVVLDEPTAQMDIPQMRTAWRFIDSEKDRRSIIVFTKSAEEASFLGDRMAILVNGEIQCRGTPTYIRCQLGGGYHLHLIKEPKAYKWDAVLDLIDKLIPGADIEEEDEQQIILNLPFECTPYFPKCFEALETQAKTLGVAHMSISYTLMEQIYNMICHTSAMDALCKDEGFRKSRMYKFTSNAELLHPKKPKRRSCEGWVVVHQFGLLLQRDFKFTYRRWLWHIVPLILVSVLKIFGYLMLDTHSIPLALPELSINSILQNLVNPKVLVKCSTDYTDQAIFCDLVKSTLEEYVQFAGQNVTLVERADDDDIQIQLLNSYTKTVQTTESPYALAIDVDFQPGDIVVTAFFNNKLLHVPALATNFLSNLILKRLKLTMTGAQTLTTTISVTNHPLPYNVEDRLRITESFRSHGYFVGLAVTWASLFCVPNIIFCFVQEKAFKQLEVIAGLNLFLFWLAKFLWNFLFWIGIVTAGQTILFMYLMEIEGFNTLDSLVAVGILCVCYGFCIFGLVGVVSYIPLFNQSPVHGFLYLFILLFFIGPCPMSVMFILSNPFDGNGVGHLDDSFMYYFHHLFLMFPTYCLGMGIFDIYTNTQHVKDCGQLDSSFKQCNGPAPHDCCSEESGPNGYHSFGHHGILSLDIHLLVEGLLFVILIIIMETSLYKIRFKWVNSKPWFGRRNKVLPVLAEEVEDLESEDAIMMEVDSAEYPILFRGLYKKVGGVKTVDNLRVGVKEGQCLGLLGVNGSGNKTILEIMAGLIVPTAGDVTVAGVSLLLHHQKYLNSIGYCPRGSMLCKEMTGREILLLIGAIRRIPSDELEDVIMTLTVRFVILAELNKLVKTYDAGSLRKLSAAVAMMGEPKLLLFEEPEMGLDPMSREDMIKAIRTERGGSSAIVLSSPNMDVCLTCCDRIAILVDGVLKCIGSPDFLRESYSEKGISLIIQLVPENSSYYDPDNEEHIPEELPEGYEDEDYSEDGYSDSFLDLEEADASSPGGPDPSEDVPASKGRVYRDSLTRLRDAHDKKSQAGYSSSLTNVPGAPGVEPAGRKSKRPKSDPGPTKDNAFRLSPRASTISYSSSGSSLSATVARYLPWEEELFPVMEFVETEFPTAKLLDTYPCFVHYHIPNEIPLSKLFRTMEIARIALELETYRVGVGNLDQLSMNFSRGQQPRVE